MPAAPISTLAFAGMITTLILCFATPVISFLLLRRRHARMAGPLVAGALAFYVSQMLIRIPLLQVGLPFLQKQGIEIGRGFFYLLALSLSAGLFEETARVGAFRLLIKERRTWASGVAFGIGHGGIEAILLIGMTYVNNLVLSTLYNRGTLGTFLEGKVPPETASGIVSALAGTSADLFFAAGLERVMTMAIHIALSLIVLEGILKGHTWLSWILAVLLHGGVNLLSTGLVAAGFGIWWSEAALLVVSVIAVVYVLMSKRRFPDESTDVDEAHKALEEGF
jgi:uncharacterized membrane protein YhfC